jgi:hypothetical protein
VDGFNQERRGLFDGLKVPFDVNAILLAALGVVVFYLGILGIEATFHMPMPDGGPSLLSAMVTTITGHMGYPGEKIEDLLGLSKGVYHFDAATWLATLTWFSVVWAFFAGAICRIAAMKIAREEGLELKDALRFGASKFVPNLLSIVFVVGIVGFFYIVCNATIAGWIGRIPVIGDVLVAILFFLVLLSSFFIVFAGALGILGFNLAAAAIATEASDTFDGVSRAWNYILARPWQVILTYGLTFAYMGIFVFCGHVFEKVAVKSLSMGNYGIGNGPKVFEVDEALARELGVNPKQRIAIPRKGEFFMRREVLNDPSFTLKVGINKDQDALFYPQLEEDGKTPIKRVGLTGQPEAVDLGTIDIWKAIDGTTKFAAGAIWFWLHLAWLIVIAYTVSYFFSAMTTIYFLLRKDVEGDDYTEINLEEDDEDDEAFEGEAHKDAPAATPEKKTSLPIVAAPGGSDKKDDHDHKH